MRRNALRWGSSKMTLRQGPVPPSHFEIPSGSDCPPRLPHSKDVVSERSASSKSGGGRRNNRHLRARSQVRDANDGGGMDGLDNTQKENHPLDAVRHATCEPILEHTKDRREPHAPASKASTPARIEYSRSVLNCVFQIPLRLRRAALPKVWKDECEQLCPQSSREES